MSRLSTIYFLPSIFYDFQAPFRKKILPADDLSRHFPIRW